MSLILDALNKADREREPAPVVPSIAAPHTAMAVADSQALPSWVFALAGALAVSVVVMLILLFQLVGSDTNHKAQASPPQHETEAAQAAPATSKPPATTENRFGSYDNAVAVKAAPLSPESSTPVSLRPEVDEAVAQLYGRANDAQPDNPQSAKPKPKAPPAAEQKPKVKSSNTKAEPLVSDTELANLWREAQQETAAPEVPASNSGGPYAQLPYLHQLPESFQERIPTLMYQNHIYTARASAVIINGATYKVGDSLGEQLVVAAITEEDLVLSYMDKPFKLAALSSWVKMN